MSAKYYKLTFETWDYEWEESEAFFFKNRKDAEEKQKELTSECISSNRSYIDEVSFEDLKNEITVTEFEDLFGVRIVDIIEKNGQMQ